MTLQARLDAIKADFVKQADPRDVALMQEARAELRRSCMLTEVRGAGQRAPAFLLRVAGGELFDSAAQLAAGPLIVTFYRGFW